MSTIRPLGPFPSAKIVPFGFWCAFVGIVGLVTLGDFIGVCPFCFEGEVIFLEFSGVGPLCFGREVVFSVLGGVLPFCFKAVVILPAFDGVFPACFTEVLPTVVLLIVGNFPFAGTGPVCFWLSF
uniref:Uncharacterized protein n=1 Tax=Cacopsylla melanoneura TaxID=428564 RepID=A0A8D8YX24_9HEMI